MFLRLVADSFGRRPRHKLLTGAALALGMAIVTAALTVATTVGDRLSGEFHSFGANLVVTPQADSLPLDIAGASVRPVNAPAYLPIADLPKLKTVFWHNNITAFAPILEVPVEAWSPSSKNAFSPGVSNDIALIGTWSNQQVILPDGGHIVTGAEQTNPWWTVDGRWFAPGSTECLVGQRFARRNNLKIGDTLNLSAGDKNHWTALTAVGILSAGGPEDDAIIASISLAQQLSGHPGQYRTLYITAFVRPEDAFSRRDPTTMTPDEFERWSCSPYVSSIAYSIKQALPGSNVRVIRRIAEGEGRILTRVRTLIWLVTIAALLAAALAVGASAAASVIERRTEIGLMKALGAGSGMIGFLLAAEQLLLAFVGGGVGCAIGIILARLVGEKIFGAAPEPSLLVLLIVLVLAAAVTLVGSAIPLRRASRYEPAPILRGE
jgi:putative ABC transport system permease protein